MGPTVELVDALYRDKVMQSRRSSREQKVLDGPELFDRACEMMKAGIRHQFPNADEAEVRAILLQRINLLRRLEGV